MRIVIIALGVAIVVAGAFFLGSRLNDNNETLGVQDTPTMINVYFPIRPKSVSQFAYTESVERTTQRDDLARFAVEQLIDGPSPAEAEVGFYSTLVLEGESTCGGEDFILRIDETTKNANLQFCKSINYRNRGDDERVQASLARTLTELPSISSLIISDAGN